VTPRNEVVTTAIARYAGPLFQDPTDALMFISDDDVLDTSGAVNVNKLRAVAERIITDKPQLRRRPTLSEAAMDRAATASGGSRAKQSTTDAGASGGFDNSTNPKGTPAERLAAAVSLATGIH
jgi:hypothetical protein